MSDERSAAAAAKAAVRLSRHSGSDTVLPSFDYFSPN